MTCSVFARILFFASLLKLLYAFNGYIEIERRDINYTNGLSVYQPDTFKIPSTMCSSNISVYCGVMGGHSVGGCKCECNSEETTFGFYDDQWKCTANSKVRQHGGCSLILMSNRTEDSALITVPLNIQANIDYLMPTNHQRCYIDYYVNKSTYLLCDGSWKVLDTNFVNKFTTAERNNTHIFIINRTKRNFLYNEVKGRILRMAIGCYDESNAIIRNCLLLKMQGTMKCPQFSLPPLPTTSPSTIPPTSATGTSSNEIQTHSIRTSISQTTTVGYKRKKNGAGQDDGGNTGLIAGVAVGVIGLTLIIVAIVIVKKRRIKRKNKAREMERKPQTDEDPIPVANYVNQGNPAFNVPHEFEYDIMPNTETANESKAIKQKEETSETLDSTTYCSLVGNVPHVYGSLKGPHKTHEDETDRQVTCTSQNKENDTYQQLNTSGQQNHGEYQAPKWSA